MKLRFLCDAARIECPRELAELSVDAIETDSRRVRQNSLFVCLRGLHTDGHTYVGDACRAGASCVLIEEEADCEIPEGIAVLRTRNTRRAVSCATSSMS